MILTVRFVILILVAAVLIGLSGRWAPLQLVGISLIAATVTCALFDWLQLRRVMLEVTRTCDDKLSLGTENLVRLSVRNSSYSGVRVAVRDEYPEEFAARGNVQSLRLLPRSEVDMVYYVTPSSRGDFTFGDVYMRVWGTLGLAIRQISFPMKRKVKVYPNLLEMRRYDICQRHTYAVQPGRRVVRFRGKGTDFESLREYVPDDDFRTIDWKASARRGKLITRQYQEEKSQNVMIVLDCGRVMGPIIAGLTRLDHSINAGMMLAYIAAIKGDKVGLTAFADDIIAYSPPRQGKSQTLNLLRLTYNLANASGDSNYYRAIPYLSRKWTRRSLIVFFTDLISPESSKPLISQIATLAKKHLCLCVAMSDPAIASSARGENLEKPEDAFIAAAARQVLHDRQMAKAMLSRAGIIVLDVPPERFTSSVVEKYLEIKAHAKL
jgi:uncharacterized protein (DUF58 family)